jgi:large subunit ribosomal protein L9
MEVILLERYRKLGNVGDTVSVKNGFARNYLIPQKKALRATKVNKEVFEAKKAEIQKEFEQKVATANLVKKALENKHILVIKQASEDDRLYGSVSSGDIVGAIKSQLSQEVSRSTVDMSVQIKYLGIYEVKLHFFADVELLLKLIVARSKEEEAKFLAEINDEAKKKKAVKSVSEEMEEILSEETVTE